MKPSDISSALLLLSILLALQVCSGVAYITETWSPTYVYDLFGSNSQYNDSKLNMDNWAVTGFYNSSNKLYNDTGTYYIGGPGLITPVGTMSRTYYNLAPHSVVYFGFSALLTGSWQSVDTFSLYLDQKGPFTFAPNASVARYAGHWYTSITGKVFHTESSLTIQASWSLKGKGSLPPAFAMKDLNIAFAQIQANDSDGVYISSSDSTVANRTGCDSKYFYNTTANACQSCDPVCRDCFGPHPTQCYRISWTGFYNGTIFLNSNDLLYCNTPNNYSSRSCGWCSSSTARSPTGTCVNTCPSPLVKYGPYNYHYCALACNSSQYAAWNNTCINSCQSPLIVTTDSFGNKTCSYPCGISKKTFLHWNGSCVTTCSYYTRVESNYQFCDACQPGYYLYDNGTCLASCQSPASSASIGGSLFCSPPIQSQFTTGKNDSKPELQYAAAVSAASITLTSFIAVSFAGTLTIGATSGLWSAINFQQFIGNFLYMNIAYPLQLEVFLRLLNSASIWTYLPNPLASLTIPILTDFLNSADCLSPYYEPPYKYDLYNQTSFFIQNGGTMLLVNIGMILLLLVVEFLIKCACCRNRLLMQIKSSLRWNVILRTFLENAIPFMQAVFLQLRRVSDSALYLRLSLSLAVISLVYAVILSSCVYNILTTKVREELERKKNKESYGTLYEGMKLHKYGKYYHTIIMLRGVLLVFMTVFVESMPAFQVVIPLLFNLALSYYLLKYADFESHVMNITNRVKEVLILFSEGCILILAVQYTDNGVRQALGWIAAILLGAVLLVEISYVAMVQIIELKAIWKKITSAVGKGLVWLKRSDRLKIRSIKVRVVEVSDSKDMSAYPLKIEK